MNVVPLVLQIAALACLTFAAFNLFTNPPNKPSWGWLGMGLWLLSLMLTARLPSPETSGAAPRNSRS